MLEANPACEEPEIARRRYDRIAADTVDSVRAAGFRITQERNVMLDVMKLVEAVAVG